MSQKEMRWMIWVTTALVDMKINNLNYIKIFEIENSQERMAIMETLKEKVAMINDKISEIKSLAGSEYIPVLFYYSDYWEEEDLDYDLEILDVIIEQIKRIYSL